MSYDPSKFEDVTKFLGEINMLKYGINPFENSKEKANDMDQADYEEQL